MYVPSVTFVILNSADNLCRVAGKVEEARTVFKGMVSKYFDWPEAIFDAWIAFEHVHGSLENLEECLDKVARAQAGVNAKRAREAQKAYLAAQATSQAAEELITSAVENGTPLQVDLVPSSVATPAAMEVDSTAIVENGKKRKADGDVPENMGESIKKPKKGSFADTTRLTGTSLTIL